MATWGDYRTPEELAGYQRDERRIWEVLGRVQADMVTPYAAMDANARPQVIDYWTDRVYRRLARQLPPRLLPYAVVLLLSAEARERAAAAADLPDEVDAFLRNGGDL